MASSRYVPLALVTILVLSLTQEVNLIFFIIMGDRLGSLLAYTVVPLMDPY